MSRVPATPVEVLVDGRWFTGTLRTCEVLADGSSCTGVVSWRAPDAVRTGRFPAALMRSVSGAPGCPADHDDDTCGAAGARGTPTTSGD